MRLLPQVCIVAVLLGPFTQTRAAEDDAVPRAIAALQAGDLSSAENILRTRLQSQPHDDEALAVLGPVLDQEKKYAEADDVYRRALAAAAPEPALLNNYGNHLLATGKRTEARKTFLRVVGMDAGNTNALVQLARLGLEQKAPAEALGYLDRLPAALRDRADLAILRMQADFALHREAEGNAILAHLSANTRNNAAESFALGQALASVGRYKEAEPLFSRTLEAEPGNFEALYFLGLAASHAGHNERAKSLLQQALDRQPENVDVLYDLAAVNIALNQKDDALALLARASHLAPQRTDLLETLALTSAGLGYFADAARVWSEYLKILPDDDTARREKAFVESAIGQDMQSGLAELSAYARKHPTDATGHYELGTAETPTQPGQGLSELNRAMSLKPDLVGAHIARGLLLYRQGKPEQALPDFEFAAGREPKNGIILDRLGEAYLSLDRAADALPVLRRAADLTPANSTVLLHLGRALSKLGHTGEAQAVFARCRQLGPDRSESPHPTGLVDFLGLSPDEQQARYRAGVEHTVRANPANADAQVKYLGILLDQGKVEDAKTVAQTLAGLHPEGPLLAEAMAALRKAGQYQTSKQLFEQSGMQGETASPEVGLELALADAHVKNLQAGLEDLDRIPASKRSGDYYLARAQMLEGLGRWQEAETTVKEAVTANPAHPELYRAASLLLIEDKRLAAALKLLDEGLRKAPNDPELLLMKALTLDMSGNRAGSDAAFKRIETLCPEWYKVWLAQALVFQSRQDYERSRSMEQAAMALGAPENVADVGRSTKSGGDVLLAGMRVLFH